MIALLMTLGLAVAPGATTHAADNSTTLKVGMEANNAPFNWTQTSKANGAVKIDGASGYANGYDVQMAKQIAKQIGKRLVVVKMSWNGLQPALTSGKIDAIIAGMSPTPERRKAIDFTSTYYKTKLTIIVRKNSQYAKATSLKDFKGAKITAQLNTYEYDAIDQIQGVEKQSAMDDFSAMRVALTSGVIDGYIGEIPEGITAATDNKALSYINFSQQNGFKVSADESDLAIGVRKGSTLTGGINQELAKISQAKRNRLMKWAVAHLPATSSEDGNWFTTLLKQYGGMLLQGAGMTLLISLVGTVVGFLIGLLAGIIRTIPRPSTAGKRGLRALANWLIAIYIEVFRGTPMIVQAAVVYYGAAQAFGLNMNRTLAALIIVSINTGAYISEIIRGGITAVDAGQFEAAHALGFTHLQTMLKVVLPQAIRNSLPAVTNEFIVNIKDTSVLSVISVSELFFSAETVAGQNFQFFHTYLVVSGMYLIMTFAISRLFRLVEKHMAGPISYNLAENH
ncbi:ABC transporter substrate-binding protein/permease [Lacticaseibacillus nasuensis]|nr:ABC transporter substrate-binding protein/permease [Lacticaseibacillus nasuensis]